MDQGVGSGEAFDRVAEHASRPGFRISEIRITPEQQVPWHHHSEIADTFYVLQGHVRISLRSPAEQVDLVVGESWGPVRAGRPHRVTNPGREAAIFLVLQGMGTYDFAPDDP
jgi:mannose-6-phosphate isomerase-like protein (cupin superfamily)